MSVAPAGPHSNSTVKARRPASKLVSRPTVRRLVFGFMIVGVTYWFFDLVQPFIMTVFWAVVIAIIFRPLYEWLLARTNNREALSASLTTVIITLVVILPFVGVVLAVIDQAAGLVGRVQSGELDPNIVINWVEVQLPIVREFAEGYNIDFVQLRANVESGIANAGQWVGAAALSITQNFFGILVDFFLMLYFLWWLVRDGEQIVELLMRALPLGNKDERMLFDRFATVSRATLKGTLIVAITQGTLGGLMFWAVGIPGALFWGVIMTLLSLLPIGGAAIVWVPAAAILFVQGQIASAIGVIAFGAVAIGLVDNLLRPLLVGRDTQMPDYLVLLATLGGISQFGLAGFVVGPIVAALFLSVWELMMREFNEKPPESATASVPENVVLATSKDI